MLQFGGAISLPGGVLTPVRGVAAVHRLGSIRLLSLVAVMLQICCFFAPCLLFSTYLGRFSHLLQHPVSFTRRVSCQGSVLVVSYFFSSTGEQAAEQEVEAQLSLVIQGRKWLYDLSFQQFSPALGASGLGDFICML